MATVRAALTPTTDTTPAIANIPAGELSGSQWVSRFPGSARVEDCSEPFRASLAMFIGALSAAGATVSISATLRPKERAYLMHWSWLIVKRGLAPDAVPSMPGVSILWVHPTAAASAAAASDMVDSFGIGGLGTPPALDSKHVLGLAVDMSISWSGALGISNSAGDPVTISSEPKSGMNAELHAVGAGFGVIKYNRSGVDRPHWSNSGN